MIVTVAAPVARCSTASHEIAYVGATMNTANPLRLPSIAEFAKFLKKLSSGP